MARQCQYSCRHDDKAMPALRIVVFVDALKKHVTHLTRTMSCNIAESFPVPTAKVLPEN
jgi:hypothetical protein